MAAAVFTSTCAMLVTTALRSNTLVDKTMSTLIHGVSAAENVADAVEKRSKIYGDGMVRNGEIAEREILLKSQMRLHNLEAQEKAVAAGQATYVPEPSLTEKLKEAAAAAKEAVSGSAKAAGASVTITPAFVKKSD
jgi:hypothetical protein